jgi:hypothetical protein
VVLTETAEKPPDLADEICFNEASEAWLKQAQKLRDARVKAEAEAARAKAKEPDPVKLGGMKKGFFDAKPKPKDKKEKKDPKAEAVPFIEPKANKYELPEVKEAMQGHTDWLKQTDPKQWMTPQLMAAIMMKPNIAAGMSDPRVMEALDLMQKDPTAAQQKYKDDKKVMDFLKEFSELMATHFDGMAKSGETISKPAVTQETAVAPVAPAGAKGDQIVSTSEFGPEVQKALDDPNVRKVIEMIQRGAQIHPRMLADKYPGVWQKLELLMKHGLLSMQS